MNRQFIRFLVVGGGAFLVDAGALQLFLFFGAHPYVARLGSLCIAIPFAFFAHRIVTYRAKHVPWRKAFLRYLMATAMVTGVNYGCYAVALLWLPPLHSMVVATALCVWLSYWTNAKHVFRQ
jgi:putative flippase GtrA